MEHSTVRTDAMEASAERGGAGVAVGSGSVERTKENHEQR